MYEESLRMPFVIKYPKVIRPQTVVTDVISNIDFASTILELPGVEMPKELQDKNFLNNLKRGTFKNWRQSMRYHYYESPFWHPVQSHYGIRKERDKLIHFYYDVNIWELYDFKKAPSELKNLINVKKHASLINKLKNELSNLKT